MFTKLKTKLDKKPKLKKVFKVIKFVFNIFVYIWFFISLIGLLMSCSNNDKEVKALVVGDYHEPQTINNVISGLNDKKPINMSITSEDNYYLSLQDLLNYFSNVRLGSVTGVPFTSDFTDTGANNGINYVAWSVTSNPSVLTNSARYVTYNTSTISNRNYTIEGKTYHICGYFTFYSANVRPYYSYDFTQFVADDGTLQVSFRPIYYPSSGSGEASVMFSSRYCIGFTAPKTNTYMQWLYNQVLPYTNVGGASQEELDEAYQNGYEQGLLDGSNDELSNQVTINNNYDFRTWLSKDYYSNLGVFSVNSLSYTHGDVVGYNIAVSGGSNWYIGNKQYNAVVLTIISLDPNLRIYDYQNSSYVLASEVFGNTYNNIFFLSAVNYCYFNESNFNSYVDQGFISANTTNILDLAVNKLKIVNGYTTAVNSSGNTYFEFKPSWVSSGFRYLNNYESLGNFVNVPNFSNSLSLRQLLELSDTPIDSGDGYFINVFGLIRSAFKSVSDIFGIQVLPHLTLGTLIFIPLIFIVIMAIIKILRK